MPTPDSAASARICQKLVANPIAAIDSDINSAPPTRNPRAPCRSTRKPTGVCSSAVMPDISITVMPSCAKLTSNACCQAMNSGGRVST